MDNLKLRVLFCFASPLFVADMPRMGGGWIEILDDGRCRGAGRRYRCRGAGRRYRLVYYCLRTRPRTYADVVSVLSFDGASPVDIDGDIIEASGIESDDVLVRVRVDPHNCWWPIR